MQADEVAPAYPTSSQEQPAAAQLPHLESCDEEGREGEDSMDEDIPQTSPKQTVGTAPSGAAALAAGAAAAMAAATATAGIPEPPLAPSAAESATAAKEKSDDCADMLSTKMLQGWALLASSCPICSTTLVRNKQKRVFCVSCDQWVLTQAEADEMDRLQQQKQLAAEAATAATGTANAAAADTATAVSGSQSPPITTTTTGLSSAHTPHTLQTPQAAVRFAAPPAATGVAVAAAVALPTATDTVVLPGVGAACVVVVTQKMREALLLLRETPVSDVGQCRALLALVGDCLAILNQPAVLAAAASSG
ncbi:MAG: hypothetical protein WDW38_001980 [Sanguina aurantia]